MIETTASSRRDLQLIRLYYFVSIGAGGFLLPFLSLFFKRQGLSGSEIGLLGTVQATVSLLVAPLTGNLSDRLYRPRLFIQLMLLGSAAITLVLGRQDQFVIMALLIALYALVSAGLSPLSDTLASDIADRYPGVGFGSIRLWGSLGWTIVTAGAGWFVERLGLYFSFVGQAVGFGISAIVMHFIPEPLSDSDRDPKTAVSLSLRQGLKAIRHNRRLANLALSLGFVWLLSSGLYQFEALYLDDLGASETTIGLANALNAAVELPAMLWADKMLKRFSAGWLLRGGLLLQALRMIAILAFPTVPMILAMRPVLGIQFSLYSVGVIGYLNAYAGKAYRVTALSLITISLRNVATMVGNPLSGMIYDAVGAYWLYGLGLIGALGGWLILQMEKHSTERTAM